MTVSVLLATYNGEKYIKEQLETLLFQSRVPDEVIIHDDNSTDRTYDIINQFIINNKLQDSWHLARNKEKLLSTKNFISCAKESTSDLIFFCDQDDIWDIKKIEIMEKLFLDNKNLIACVCDKYFIDQKGKRIKSLYKNIPNKLSKSFRAVSMDEAIRYNFSSGLCLAVRREFYLDLVDTIIKEKLTHDSIVGIVASIYDGFYILPMELVGHRQHLNNVSKPHYTVMSRISDKGYQIKGKVFRLQLMLVVRQYYSAKLSDKELLSLDKAICKKKETIGDMKNDRLLHLFFKIFERDKFDRKMIRLNDFLCVLFNKLCFQRRKSE